MSEELSLTEMLSATYQLNLKVPDHFLYPEKDMIQQDIQDDDIYQSYSQTYPVSTRIISNNNSDQNQFDGTTINNFVQNRDNREEIYQSNRKNIQDDVLPSIQEQNPLTTTSTTKLSKQKGRQDDSNNFFKKYITIVSKCLPSNKKQKFSKIKRLLNSIEKLDTKKSSRQGFSCLLLNIRYILGKKTLLKVYSNYRKTNPYQFLKFKNEKAKAYFERTRPAYSLAWKSFLKLKLVSCVKYTYLMTSSFKQRTYRKQGIQYAKQYKQQLKRLLSKAKQIKKSKK